VAYDNAEAIRELFSEVLPVTVRRMFGGHGVYADGIMFALESGGEIFLKADEQTIPGLQAEGSSRFIYPMRGREVSLPYWRLPERCYDEPDELKGFVEAAVEVSRRAKRVKKPAKTARRK
jgi:DNA transformation protein